MGRSRPTGSGPTEAHGCYQPGATTPVGRSPAGHARSVGGAHPVSGVSAGRSEVRPKRRSHAAVNWAGSDASSPPYGSTATGARQNATFCDCWSITLTWHVYRLGSSFVNGMLILTGCTLACALKPSFANRPRGNSG